MRRITTIILILTATVIWAADDQLVIKGSTTVLPIAQACAEEYMDANPDADISIMGGGSGVGIASLLDGTTDIANASREIKAKELTTARSSGLNPFANVVAIDGIAIITHKDIPVKDISLEQLRDIYTGKIDNWNEVGGPSKQIVLVSRDVSSGTYEVFKEKVLEGAMVTDKALKIASNQAALKTVTDTPGAIGYVGFGYLNSKVNAPNVNGIAPTLENASSKAFPIVRPLFMYTNGTPKGMTKEFIDYILSEEGQSIVEEMGYIPLN